MSKKRIELMDIVPLTGSFVKEEVTGYFEFLKHIVQEEPWFIEVVEKYEETYYEVFGKKTNLDSLGNYLRDQEIMYHNPKNYRHFITLQNAIVEHVVTSNYSLNFLLNRIEMSRSEVLAEVRKIQNRGKHCFEIYPLPKDKLTKLYNEALSSQNSSDLFIGIFC